MDLRLYMIWIMESRLEMAFILQSLIPGLQVRSLIEELLYYGISAISLSITGSERTEGLRACVSLVQRSQFPELESRLKKFNQNHPYSQ